MFDKNNWKTDTILRGIARIPINQAHFLLALAMLGGLLFVGGVCLGAPLLKANAGKIPDPLVFITLGFACFVLFFPLPYVIYLAKELQTTKERLDELEGRNDGGDPVSADL